ncbi:homoserine dehydrogenase [Clostridium thailandense]|uniref:homoserine dehydrogenase n=1 Tax=Clostridium thailandense TaxID=2794346 RepID=UPI003989F46D
MSAVGIYINKHIEKQFIAEFSVKSIYGKIIAVRVRIKQYKYIDWTLILIYDKGEGKGMRIGLIGYGGVGKAFIKLIADKNHILKEEGMELEVIYIMNSKGGIYDPNGIDYNKLLASSDKVKSIIESSYENKKITPDYMLEKKDVDLIIELTPTNKETGEPSLTYIRKALESKIHVVTGNKGSIIHGYRKLERIARENCVHLGIGCTCGGALPSINGGVIEMAGSEIYSIEGVLNGTTNYILKEMEDTGCTYDVALKKAQDLGIAESNPSFDVEGWDTAFKLLILTNVIMKEEKTLSDMEVEGITSLTPEDIKIALEEGKRYKLIGRTFKNGKELRMSVSLSKVGKEHSFYNVDGKNKAVRYISDTLGELTLIGGASGTTAAAASILRDIIYINRIYGISYKK